MAEVPVTEAPAAEAPGAEAPGAEPLLEVQHLGVRYGRTTAVDDVGFTVRRGRTLGLVGESGSGKSSTGLAVLRLVEPAAGTVLFDGVDVRGLGRGGLRRFRRRASMVFQDPYACLDPRHTAGRSVAEPLTVHGLHRGAARRPRLEQLFGLVGLAPQLLDRYPHELSGGQRQRVGVARALAVEPELVVLDEPIASLDVSVQAQVMNLLVRLQRELGLSYLFIAHDLAAVRHLSDDVVVMHRGRVVESGTAEQVYGAPRHDYTRALLAAVPRPDPAGHRGSRRSG